MTPCFKWTSIIEKKFLENFMEMTMFVKISIWTTINFLRFKDVMQIFIVIGQISWGP